MLNLLARLYPEPTLSHDLEVELLLLCVRGNLEAWQIERIRQLSHLNIAWDRLITLVVNHKVHPLVYWNLKNYAAGLVPEKVVRTLKGMFATNMLTNVRNRTELIRILKAFEEEKIDVLPLRGVVVSYLLYGEFWMRDFKDLDILVRRADFEQAETLLMELGYVREAPVEDNAYNQKFFYEKLKIQIELHWRLDTPSIPIQVDEENYWQHVTNFNVEGIHTHTFQPDDLLLLLAVHGAKHRWNRLKWLCDIDQFVACYPDFDWTHLLNKSEAARVKRIVLLSLWMCHTLFHTHLPQVVTNAIDEDATVPLLGYYIKRWLFKQTDDRLIDQLRGIGYFLFIRENPEDRVFSVEHALQYPKVPILKWALKMPVLRYVIKTMVRSVYE